MHRLFAVPTILLLLVAGCINNKDDQAFSDATVVLQYIIDHEADGTEFSFQTGALHDGTAVFSKEGLAFWVKDGTGYTVNEAARQVAPDLEQAPDFVKFDNEFRASLDQY